MSGAYIVYPQGDFDGNAIVVDADSAEEAAYMGWNDNKWNLSCTVCVLPFQDDIQFRLVVEVDND